MGSAHVFFLLMLLNWGIGFALGWVFCAASKNLRKSNQRHDPGEPDDPGHRLDVGRQCESLQTVLRRDLATHSELLKEFDVWLRSRTDDPSNLLVEAWTKEATRVQRANEHLLGSLGMASDLINHAVADCPDVLSDQRQRLDEYQEKAGEFGDVLNAAAHQQPNAEQIGQLSDSARALQQENETLQSELQVCREELLAQMALSDAMAAAMCQDAITQIPNRRAFDDKLREQHASFGCTERPYTVLIFGVDGLGDVNERFGHTVGDAVLAMIGRVFRESQRSGHFAARYDENRFAILIPDGDPDQARSTAERHRERVAAASLRFAEHQVKVTISCGIAQPFPGARTSTVTKAADRALAEAKADGGNQIRESDPAESTSQAVASVG